MMGEIREAVTANLNYYIKKSGLEQKDIAAAVGVSAGAVTNWLRGKNTPDIEVLNLLCKFLGVSLTDMLEIKKPDAIKSVGPCDEKLMKLMPRLTEAQKQSLCVVAETYLPEDTGHKE
jgi:transcriptional regulator with XRE-family HTH domain